MLKYMLDTNIVIYRMKKQPASVRAAFKKHYGRMCISSITSKELIYGAERSSNPEPTLTSLEGLVARMDVLPLGDLAAVNADRSAPTLLRHQARSVAIHYSYSR
jgi:tRNA(fMet)-specific endonuclease VapC